MFRGLFKKVVLADLLAGLGVDSVFANPEGFSSVTLLLAIYGYSFQIYNDFSGYSDIAIGAARVLGFDIPENFNRPYLARNVREFWTRWHISLSSWLRDYLYIPLGGSRRTPKRVRFNLMATMVLGGPLARGRHQLRVVGLLARDSLGPLQERQKSAGRDLGLPSDLAEGRVVST